MEGYRCHLGTKEKKFEREDLKRFKTKDCDSFQNPFYFLILVGVDETV